METESNIEIYEREYFGIWHEGQNHLIDRKYFIGIDPAKIEKEEKVKEIKTIFVGEIWQSNNQNKF